MKTLKQKTRYFGSSGSKLVCTFIFASVISVLSISSALADRDDGHGGGHRHHQWRGNQGGYRGFRPGYQQPNFGYAQPVYVPPPVYYAPQQSPGISLFLPLNIHR